MSPVEWTAAQPLDHKPMDKMHREFIEVLATAERAQDAELARAWGALVDHTAALFELENRWMQKTRLAGATEHQWQRRVVLNLLREGLAMARAGEYPAVREMAIELGAWFAKHTQAMDAALAQHLRDRSGPGNARCDPGG